MRGLGMQYQVCNSISEVCSAGRKSFKCQFWTPLFKQSTLKNDLNFFLSKNPFLSTPMRGLGLQYQVRNSISKVCGAGNTFKMSILDPRLQT